MYGDREIELWFLGLPFDDCAGEGRESEADVSKLCEYRAMSDEEAERLYLGLPFKAA